MKMQTGNTDSRTATEMRGEVQVSLNAKR